MRLFARILTVLALLLAAPALATVTSPTSLQVDNANGSTTAFAYNFLIPYQADGVTPAVTVSVFNSTTNSTTVLSPSQYSITGVGNASGGTVNYPLSGSPLASGSTVTISRSYAYTQNTSVSNTGFYPHTVELVADSLEYQIQQLATTTAGLSNAFQTGPVQSFEGRTGAVSLQASDVVSAMTFALPQSAGGTGNNFGFGLDDVRNFGAVSNCTNGNGIGSTCTDNKNFFSQAIVDAAATGRNVYIPCGDYWLSSGITLNSSGDTTYLNSRPQIIGAGAHCTHLYFGTGGAINGITVLGSTNSTASVSMQVISGVSIIAGGGGNTGTGLFVQDMDHIHLSDIYVQGFGLGIYLNDVQESMMENIMSLFNATGGMQIVEGSDLGTPPNAITIIGSTFGLNGNYGLDVQNPSNLLILGGTIENNGGLPSAGNWGLRVIYPMNTDIESNEAATISGVYFERNTGSADILFSNGQHSPNMAEALTIVGNNFNRGWNSTGSNTTITTGTPTVVTLTGHNFVAGQAVQFQPSAGGTLPTGITQGTGYFVLAAGLTANTFEISATAGGSPLTTSGSYTGTPQLFTHAMNVVQIQEANGNPTKVTLLGNGMGGKPQPGTGGSFNPPYAPSASTPYVTVTNTSEPIQICSLGNSFQDNIEVTNSTWLNCPVNGSMTFSNSSKVSAQNASAQNTNSGVITVLTGWTALTFDQDSNFNVSTGIFTAPVTGYYRVTGQIVFGSTMPVGTLTQMDVLLNGVVQSTGQVQVGNATIFGNAVTVNALVFATAGQSISVAAFQNSGSAVALTGNAAVNFLTISQEP